MKVTFLILSCLAYFASAQLITIPFTSLSSCTGASGCNLADILSAASILNIISASVTGQSSYALDFSQLSGSSTVNVAATGSLSNSITVAAFSTGSAVVNIASGFVVNTANFAVQGGQTTVSGTVSITNSAAYAANVTVATGATLVVATGGSIAAQSSAIASSGNTVVAGQISTTATYTQNTASLILNTSSNTAAVIAGSVLIASGATLSGNGAIGGSSAAASAGVSVNVSGTVSVGNSPGVVTINGDWRPSSTSFFNFEAASSSNYDQLIVTGKAYVAGGLKCTLINNYGPADNTRFPFITAQATTGSFGATVGTGNNVFKWSSSVTSTQVIANFNSAASVAISALVLVACVLASLL